MVSKGGIFAITEKGAVIFTGFLNFEGLPVLFTICTYLRGAVKKFCRLFFFLHPASNGMKPSTME